MYAKAGTVIESQTDDTLDPFERLGYVQKPAPHILKLLQETLRDQLPDILDVFYADLEKIPSLSPFVEGKIQKLKDAQIAHWSKVMSFTFDQEYLRRVKNVGIAHDRHNIPPDIYVASYGRFCTSFQSVITEKGLTESDRSEALVALTKACFLDLALCLREFITERDKNIQFLLWMNQPSDASFSLEERVKTVVREALPFLKFEVAQVTADQDSEFIKAFVLRAQTDRTQIGEDNAVLSERAAEKLKLHIQDKKTILWVSAHQLEEIAGEPLQGNATFKSCAVIPLKFHEIVFGTITLFSQYPRAQENQTLQVLEGMSLLFSSLVEKYSTQSFYHHNLRRLSFYDGLTGLPNRALFMDRLEQVMKRPRRLEGMLTAIYFVDIDNFKDINDTLGHGCGDALLKAFARNLTTSMRSEDTAARVGGDEFLIMACDLEDEAHAEEMSKRLMSICGGVYKIGDTEVQISVSIGGLILSEPNHDLQQLLQKVDIAALQAKKQGKNRVVLFNPQFQEQFLEEKKLVQEMEKALRKHQFRLYYQPVVDILKQTAVSFEGLVRWMHPEHGFMMPGRFVPIAEGLPLILDLGLEVLEMALQDIQAFTKGFPGHPSLNISINLSPRQLSHEDHFTKFLHLIDSVPGAAQHLRIEVTESSFENNVDLMRLRLKAFKDRGIKTLIDDFGTGYSSLSYLRQFEFDYLKIDGSFVKDVPTCDKSLRLLKGVIDIAQGQGIQIIAEGVETKRQLDLLIENGCHLIQGYYFSKPLPFQETNALLGKCLLTPNIFMDKIIHEERSLIA